LQNRKLKIGIVVGEVSGDTLGAQLMRRFREQGIDAEFEGIGGPQMIAEGFKSYYPMDILSVMGIVEVLKDLKKLFAVRDGLLDRWTENPVDVFIGIDAPDFNLRLGKVLKAKGIFSVQYVSPSIWAWREDRIEKIKQATHLVLCLFPFELPVYQKHGHPAVCVGHPLLKTINPALTRTPTQELRRELIWDNDGFHDFFAKAQLDEISNLIAVMPGSRTGEIKAIFPKMLAAMKQLLIMDSTLCFIVPTVTENHRTMINVYLENESAEVRNRIAVSCDESQADFSQQVMAVSDLVLLASGTATLEGMLLNRPMVVIYVMKNLTYQLAKRLVKIPYVSLPNILAGREIVPELIQDAASADNISRVVQQTLALKNYNEQLAALQQTSDWLREQSNVNPANAVIDGWLDWVR
jgi:lipid-A-disaccharide synthase